MKFKKIPLAVASIRCAKMPLQTMANVDLFFAFKNCISTV
jgi:hypothetical protein